MIRARAIPYRRPPPPRWSDAVILACVLVLIWMIALPILAVL